MTAARDDWRWVRALGRIGGGAELNTLLRALIPTGVPAVAAAVADHDVTEIALANLQAANPRGTAGAALVAAVESLVAERAAYRIEVRPAMRDAITETARLGGHVLHGLAMLRLYPDPEMRHLGDVDVHFSELDGALELTRALRARSWEWDLDSLPWLSWDENGQVYGKLPLLLRERGRLLTFADVRFGRYYVGWAGAMPLAFEPGRVWDVEISAPTPECTVATLAGNASDDCRISMKDVNDAARTAAAGRLDWALVDALVRPLGLEGVARQLAAAADADYAIGSPFATERADRPLPTRTPPALRSALHRSGITYLHERRRGPLWRAAGRSATAFLYHTVDVAPRRGRWPGPSAPLRGYRWRLVPEDVWRALGGRAGWSATAAVEELSAELRLVRAGGSAVVTWRDEVFIPTVWGRLPRPALDLARAVKAGSIR